MGAKYLAVFGVTNRRVRDSAGLLERGVIGCISVRTSGFKEDAGFDWVGEDIYLKAVCLIKWKTIAGVFSPVFLEKSPSAMGLEGPRYKTLSIYFFRIF